MIEEDGGQLALLKTKVRKTRPVAPSRPAPERPIAKVVVDTPLAHLDRTFDYVVPEKFHDDCQAGTRVRVRFAGQDLDGFVLDRLDDTDHQGKLLPIKRLVSPEQVLAPQIAKLARAVADRYAGTLYDVLRLAVPPRHARVEAEERKEKEEQEQERPAPGQWAAYETGARYLDALERGENPRAAWTALPGEDWPRCLAKAAAATLASGRGVLLIVPDHRDAARLDEACKEELGDGQHVLLSAEVGPAMRYRRFLAVRRGDVRCVVGTRAAAFAPVRDLGLVGCWDDGDDLHAEQRAPYPHVREVLLLRAHQENTAAIIGGFAVTAEGAQLVETGWARPLAAARDVVRRRAPRVVVTDDADLARDPAARAVRIPHRAFEIARDALGKGPVLIQVPRAGYLPALACQDCRQTARCTNCHGPLQRGAPGSPPACGWCGRAAVGWECPHCGGRTLRAPVVGARRTAEELGRAFPRFPVKTSGGEKVLTKVSNEPALVVATPGAEPVATDGGYAAAMLLDTWLFLARADLRAGEEALRRWFSAAALVRPGDQGGSVIVVGDPAGTAIQALVRWSPDGYASRELVERQHAGFPPAVRLATIEGPSEVVQDLVDLAQLPETASVLGPVPVESSDDEELFRTVIRVPRAQGGALSAALKGAQGVRSARKSPGNARVRIDPLALA